MASSDLAPIGAGLAHLNALCYHHLVPFALVSPTSGERIHIVSAMEPMGLPWKLLLTHFASVPADFFLDPSHYRT